MDSGFSVQGYRFGPQVNIHLVCTDTVQVTGPFGKLTSSYFVRRAGSSLQCFVALLGLLCNQQPQPEVPFIAGCHTGANTLELSVTSLEPTL